MKAKLSKEAGGYDLYRIDEDGKRVTFASTQDYKQKLSLKNCEAIANGYDLDELADENVSDIHEANTDFMFKDIYREFFKEGFQKALEILGNKKFTFDQMLYVAGYAVGLSTRSKLNPSIDIKQETLDFIHKMEQSEWDVEVEMEYYDPLPPTRQTSLRPKLDADGCLILKRK